MKRLILSVLATGAMICTSFSPLMADDLNQSGNAFLRHCSVAEKDHDLTSADQFNEQLCEAYIAGFVEGASEEIGFSRSKGESPSQLFCLQDSSNFEGAQWVRIVVKYIRANPETANLRTAALVTRAFQAAFPCRA